MANRRRPVVPPRSREPSGADSGSATHAEPASASSREDDPKTPSWLSRHARPDAARTGAEAAAHGSGAARKPTTGLFGSPANSDAAARSDAAPDDASQATEETAKHAATGADASPATPADAEEQKRQQAAETKAAAKRDAAQAKAARKKEAAEKKAAEKKAAAEAKAAAAASKATGAAAAPRTNRTPARATGGGSRRPATGSASSTQPVPSVVGSARTRTARLRLVHVDPWSVMKTAFLLSIALGVIMIVAVTIIWGILGAAGVWDSINSSVRTTIGSDSSEPFNITDYIGAGRVIGFTMVAAVIDVVVMTALATLGAFVYNLAATLLGGVEMTLAEDR